MIDVMIVWQAEAEEEGILLGQSGLNRRDRRDRKKQR